MELARSEMLAACFNPVFLNLYTCRVRPDTFVPGSEGQLREMVAAMKVFYKVTPEEWTTLLEQYVLG